MITEVYVPNFAESISEVIINVVLVASDSKVTENQGIAELESEKVNHLIYAPTSGKIVWEVKEGDVVAVGALIAKIYSTDEEKSSSSVQHNISTSTVDIEKSSDHKDLVSEQKVEIIDFPSEQTPSEPPNKRFVPLKDKVAHSLHERETRQRMSSIRKTISKRLLQAMHESAMLTTFNEVNMSALLQLRKERQELFIEKYGVKLGLMSFFIKASVLALKEFPKVNAYIDGNDIVYRHYYDLSIAIGTDRGLVVPVIRNVDQLSSGAIETELVNLASKARDGSLSFSELQGGCFTITNGGVYGSLLSTPILNPPQVGILGMHKIEKRPIVQDGQIIAADMMYIALSYDHRMIDGKEAVGFLVKIKECIENPESLLDM